MLIYIIMCMQNFKILRQNFNKRLISRTIQAYYRNCNTEKLKNVTEYYIIIIDFICCNQENSLTLQSHYKLSLQLIHLDRHIEILLLNNNCVIVPGLGGFMTHHVVAQYYPDTQSYLPPLRQLGFNANIQINDSLLAQSYIETYDISYPEAIRRINEEVEEMKQVLQNEGKCELTGIGVLKMNIGGTIEFEPCDAGILTPELYGLNSVDITPLATVAEEKTAKVTNIQETPKSAAHLSHSNTLLDDDANVDEEDVIKIKVSTLRNIGTVAAAIIIFFIFALPLGDNPQVKLSESYMDTGILYNILPEELRASKKAHSKEKISFHKTAKSDITKAEKKPTESPTAVSETNTQQKADTTDEVQEAKPQGQYSIVLASRVSRANAEEFVSKMKKHGFSDTEIVERANGLKVIHGHFQTQEEAYNYLYNVRSKNKNFDEGWVMKF